MYFFFLCYCCLLLVLIYQTQLKQKLSPYYASKDLISLLHNKCILSNNMKQFQSSFVFLISIFISFNIFFLIIGLIT